MMLALRIGRRGLGRTSPNPPVGAVIVRNGEVIGRGWHKKSGLPHAEIEAIADAERNGVNDFRDATMYVTLEPCCHYGKTPPCASLIVSKGFSRVVIGVLDPNPAVCGKGMKALRDANIDVTVGVLKKEAKRLIEHFEIFVTKGRACLAVKWAQSLDGKIAAEDGSSRWISSEQALKFAHRLRDIYDAVIIGAGTLRTDDPSLTVRYVKGRNPVRIVVGGRERISAKHRVFSDGKAKTVLASSLDEPFYDGEPTADVEIWQSKVENDTKIQLKWLLEKLAQEGLTSALMEGGSKLIGSAIVENIADRIYAIVTPKIIGTSGIDAVGAKITKVIDDLINLHNVEIKRLGHDVMISGRIKY